jgi:dihydroorotase-like cyclic amidohydrolase
MVSDADLILINMHRKGKIMGKKLHSKIKWTPFEGWEIMGFPFMTLVRGEKIMEDGEIVGEPGHGTFIPALTNGKNLI